MIDISSLVSLLIYIVVIGLIAWVIIYVAERMLPQFANIVRVVVGVIALIAVLLAVARFFGIAV